MARAERTSRRQEANAVRASIVLITVLPSFSSYLFKLLLCGSFLLYGGVCLGSVLGFIVSLSTRWITLIRHLQNARPSSQVQSRLLMGRL